jgi:hypothetical protein
VGDHFGLTIDLQRGEFRAPHDKLNTLAKQALSMFGREASNTRYQQRGTSHSSPEKHSSSISSSFPLASSYESYTT